MSTPLRRLTDPLREFVRLEAAGGVVLLAATVAALAWANSPWQDAYEQLSGSVHAVVNEGLMTVFFFVVGLEIKRELVGGELRDRSVAVLPAIAALGGMVAPALLYTLLNAGGDGANGWGIPMATDIAFALGVTAVLGRRVPASLRLFLLSLAVADDIGAIVVIAVFYSPGLVHPTVAGVAVGLLIPAGPVAERLEKVLHRWTSFVVIPVFALVNAGVRLTGGSLGDVLGTPVGRGVLVGLVAGKVVGITSASWLAVRLGLARLPEGVRWPQLVGVAALAGIGFTVSLFITGLAFPDPSRQGAAKLAVLAASALAALLGSAILWAASRRSSEEASRSGTVADS